MLQLHTGWPTHFGPHQSPNYTLTNGPVLELSQVNRIFDPTLVVHPVGGLVYLLAWLYEVLPVSSSTELCLLRG